MPGAMNTVYKRKNYKIYDAGKEFIVHNSSHDFSNYHTHITNFNTCRYLIDLCIHKTVPHHLSEYLLESILRLSDDPEYCSKIKIKLNQTKEKHQKAKKREGYHETIKRNKTFQNYHDT